MQSKKKAVLVLIGAFVLGTLLGTALSALIAEEMTYGSKFDSYLESLSLFPILMSVEVLIPIAYFLNFPLPPQVMLMPFCERSFWPLGS